MKAVIQNKYGGVETLEMVKANEPVYKENGILVEIHSTNVASGDYRVNTLAVPFVLKIIMRLVFGLFGPRNKIRGISASGKVIEVGHAVTKFKVGDDVYFINSMKAGCLAEFVSLKETGVIVKKPKSISYTEAAPIAFGALSAIHFINEETIKKDQSVLIYGASGSVGTYAIQLAKYYGAEVTAVSSKKNHELLVSLGASHTIDYKTNDFRALKKQYDVIFDAVGLISKKSSKDVLKEGGKYLTVKMPTKESVERLEKLNVMIEEGKLKTIVDQVYPFDQFKEAHEHTYNGHKVGNVIIEIKEGK